MKVNDGFTVVLNLKVFEVLGDRDIVDVVHSADRGFRVFKLRQRRLPSVDQQLGSDNDLGAVANEDLLTVEEEGAVKRVLFGFASELAHLREGAMLHDDLVGNLALAIGNENSALFFVRFVEFLLEEDSSLVVQGVAALADLFLVVKDVQQVAGDCGSEDE